MLLCTSDLGNKVMCGYTNYALQTFVKRFSLSILSTLFQRSLICHSLSQFRMYVQLPVMNLEPLSVLSQVHLEEIYFGVPK